MRAELGRHQDQCRFVGLEQHLGLLHGQRFGLDERVKVRGTGA
jgi:hypothetical protein